MKNKKQMTEFEKLALKKAVECRALMPPHYIKLVNAWLVENGKKTVSNARVSQVLSGYNYSTDIAEAIIKASEAYQDRLFKLAQ